MGRRAAERLEDESELRQALETGSLQVYYQPVVELSSGRVLGVEALARWHHRWRGIIPPAVFISLAEETGLIMPLGRWVLDEACRQVRLWHESHVTEIPLTLSVNISAHQLRQPDLVATVRQELLRHRLPAETLTLEITESCLLQESDARQVRQLAALGVKLAIDDFGTGYSSLSYISRLPIDALKIDRSFITRLGQERESTAVVQTIIALTQALQLSVTAEGIETVGQAEQLQALGCNRGQGFLYAEPRPAAEVRFGSATKHVRAA